MSSSPFNHALLRGLLAGAVVLTGTACSRPDRAESGSDNSASMAQDTTSIAAPTAPGDTAMTDSAAGYRAMDRDTATVSNESDSARVTHDPSETSQAPSDTAAVESSSAPVGAAAVGATAAGVEMARDTSTMAEQTDTLAVSDTAEASDDGRSGAVLAAGAAGAAVAATDPDSETRGDAGSVPSSTAVSDTAGTVQAQVDTSHHAEASDSGRAGAVLAAGAAGAAVGAASRDDATADRTDITESDRVRSPEDSTEILGNVTTTDEAADETADEQIINPRADEVGAAALASDVTGAEAVALMSREGVRCAIVDPEENEAVRWDMSSTPVALNPCGMGSMVLSRIWTKR